MSELLAAGRASRLDIEALKRQFELDGYLYFEDVVPKEQLTRLSTEILTRLDADLAAGRLFAGGGSVSGHLNCFPGAQSRFVYQALRDAGIFEVVQALSQRRLGQPNIGCNLNLPGSTPQNEHIDGYAAEPFLIVNVAAVDTTLSNGAMEILAGTQRKTYKFWEMLLARPPRRRMPMWQGDALVRVSTLWHRGMPNLSSQPRPMLAFTWEGGGSEQADPYAVHDGAIAFLPNRFRTDWKGRLSERAFVAAPRLGTAYQAVRSLFGDRVL